MEIILILRVILITMKLWKCKKILIKNPRVKKILNKNRVKIKNENCKDLELIMKLQMGQ
jgi:hypothetical protein